MRDVPSLKHLDLFSGLGGFSLGLEATGGFETVAFCDIEKFPRKVLKQHWPDVKQYKDIKELTYERLQEDGIGNIDIITGGYPCQPFSVAGRQRGEKDKRHLWPEMFRLIKECRPTWIIGENVGGHIKLGLDTVLSDLESEGYSTRTFSISASSIGANHKRERIWIVAHSECNGSSTTEIERGIEKTISEKSERENNTLNIERASGISITKKNVANSNSNDGRTRSSSEPQGRQTRMEHGSSSTRQSFEKSNSYVADTESSNRYEYEINGEHGKAKTQEIFRNRSGLPRESTWWSFEPEVGRVANGIPNRVDRLKCLGNSVVPQIPYILGLSILKTYE